jgi:uncharacterized membrane protein YiaA
MSTSRPRYANVFKLSFVSGAGQFLGLVPQLLLGITLFIIGLVIKNTDTKAKGFAYYLGFILMALGCALGLGFGSDKLLSNIFNN